jgi:hypothetical protein
MRRPNASGRRHDFRRRFATAAAALVLAPCIGGLVAQGASGMMAPSCAQMKALLKSHPHVSASTLKTLTLYYKTRCVLHKTVTTTQPKCVPAKGNAPPPAACLGGG